MTSNQSAMTKKERVRATLAGKSADRVPFTLWHHFPETDRTVEGLVNATVDFHQKFDVDLIKLMPTGMYSVLDYGATIELAPGDSGTTQLKTTPISSPSDWAKLTSASPSEGILAEQVEVVRQVREKVGPDVPVLQTIFSPVSMANKLVGSALNDHLSTDEDAVHPALELFTGDVIAFGRACLDAGADGFFFATQQASRDAGLSDELYARVGSAFDIRVLQALKEDERNWCTMLHLHGTNARFELANEYPIHAVNWHDRESGPPIKDAANLTQRTLVAGIDRIGPAASGDIDGLINEVKDAIAQAGEHPIIVAPSCVLPYTVQESTLRPVRDWFQSAGA